MALIYLVDDDADDRFLLNEAIMSVADTAIIIEAENGFDFIEKLPQSTGQVISLILLDMNMPKMNGLETITHIKSITKYKEVPLVMVTTSSHDTIREKALAAGSSMFKVKPNTFEEFVNFAEELKQRYL